MPQKGYRGQAGGSARGARSGCPWPSRGKVQKGCPCRARGTARKDYPWRPGRMVRKGWPWRAGRKVLRYLMSVGPGPAFRTQSARTRSPACPRRPRAGRAPGGSAGRGPGRPGRGPGRPGRTRSGPAVRGRRGRAGWPCSGRGGRGRGLRAPPRPARPARHPSCSPCRGPVPRRPGPAADGGDERVVFLVFGGELRGVVAAQAGHAPPPLNRRVGDLIARITHPESVSLTRASDAVSRVFPGRRGGARQRSDPGRPFGLGKGHHAGRCAAAAGRGR